MRRSSRFEPPNLIFDESEYLRQPNGMMDFRLA
jgi:hypothetical protein